MTAHEEFFKELRAAREAKGITLDDISRATLIDRKYLEAIEEAEEQVLPAAYVRAFIREYAAAIGLNPNDVMKRFEQTSRPPGVDSTPAHAMPAPSTTGPADRTARKPWWENRLLLYTLIGAAAVCIIAVILDLSKSTSPREVREIPFNATVRENERRLFPGDTAKSPASVPPIAVSDSLLLSVASLDSV